MWVTYDENLANFIKQNTQQKGKKKGTKRENLSPSLKCKTQSGSLRYKGTYHVSKAPTNCKKHIRKRKKMKKPERALNLENPSLIMATLLKIEMT
jgi:uncharacterized pyridoxal phosphate-containing UPF0001 family protein